MPYTDLEDLIKPFNVLRNNLAFDRLFLALPVNPSHCLIKLYKALQGLINPLQKPYKVL